MLRAETHRARREQELATAAYEEAVVQLEERLESAPDDFRLLSAVGIAYAGIGRRDDALRVGRRAVEKLSMEMDALNGSEPIKNLALINTMVGDYEAAFDGIEQVLSVPSFFSVGVLELDPRWDPLRELPRYQEILTKYR